MSFNFLPDTPKNSQSSSASNNNGAGTQFNVGQNYFFDNYNNHFDVQRLITYPITRQQFNLNYNFQLAKDKVFDLDQIKSLIDSTPEWYGLNTNFDELVNGYTKFQNPELLSNILTQLKQEIPNELFSGIEKPKMKINDRFGMFSFDLASMAMTYVYEYFNKQGEKVDSNFVQKVGTDFVFTPTNELVTQEIKKQPNGNPVVVSSVRNSLIDFEKKEKRNRAVEIFISCEALAKVLSKDYIFNAMAGISVAQNLALKGFQVKITCLITTHDSSLKKNFFHFVPVKNYNEPLDINAVAYVCGDTRFYRFQGFKAIFMGWDKINEQAKAGLGTTIGSLELVSKTIEKEYITNSKRKQADTRLYFGNSRSIEEVKNEVKTAIKILELNYGNTN